MWFFLALKRALPWLCTGNLTICKMTTAKHGELSNKQFVDWLWPLIYLRPDDEDQQLFYDGFNKDVVDSLRAAAMERQTLLRSYGGRKEKEELRAGFKTHNFGAFVIQKDGTKRANYGYQFDIQEVVMEESEEMKNAKVVYGRY